MTRPDPAFVKRTDPVDRKVADMTAEEMTDWLIECHGLPATSRATVVSNIREQYLWHRLRGRLDRHPWLAALAELWLRTRAASTASTAPTSSTEAG